MQSNRWLFERTWDGGTEHAHTRTDALICFSKQARWGRPPNPETLNPGTLNPEPRTLTSDAGEVEATLLVLDERSRALEARWSEMEGRWQLAISSVQEDALPG